MENNPEKLKVILNTAKVRIEDFFRYGHTFPDNQKRIERRALQIVENALSEYYSESVF